jgi:hypothetical protein
MEDIMKKYYFSSVRDKVFKGKYREENPCINITLELMERCQNLEYDMKQLSMNLPLLQISSRDI